MSPRRKWLLVAGIAAIVLLALLLSLRFALQPERVTRLILERAGRALGLEITAGGVSEYRLRGTPMVVVRDVVAREPGATKPLLRAKRIHLSLPWATLRARGADLTVERVELDAPVLDLPALQHWLSTRPPGESRIPTLTDGLRITNGTLENGNWSIDAIDIDMPSLAPNQPVDAKVRGRYTDPPRRITFDLAVAMSKPAKHAGFAALGPVTVHSNDWSLPAQIKLSGPLRIDDGAVRMTPARLAMTARYKSASNDIPFVLGLFGPLQFKDGVWAWAPAGVALRGEDRVPDLTASGALAFGRTLVIELDGAIPAWPEAWPALPPPLSASKSALAFGLRYHGKADLTSVAALRLQRDATRFSGRLRVFDVSTWISSKTPASPLPPLDGVLTTPTLNISGAQLEGVEITFDDPDIPAIEPAP